MNSITVIIHTHNEQDTISECITSARLLSDDVLVVDMESADETKKRAEKAGATVISFPFSGYVEPAREFGIRNAKGAWVCILDADERMTRSLAQEIQQKLDTQNCTH